MKHEEAQKKARDLIKNAGSLAWFEEFYAQSGGDDSRIPWAKLRSNPHLTSWLEMSPPLSGKALVIGCGLGDDAEELSRTGFMTTAFDISTSAVERCKKRFPDSSVEYRSQDLFNTPDNWFQNYDFVFEAHTVQSLPLELRRNTIKAIADFVAPAGKLLVICDAVNPDEEIEGPPWPLLHSDMQMFCDYDLHEQCFEELFDSESLFSSLFRAIYHRGA